MWSFFIGVKMNTKVCNGPCGKCLPATLEFFHKQKGGLFGLRSKCKTCRSKEKKKHRQENKQEILKKEAKYRSDKSEYLREYLKEYRHQNKEEIKKQRRGYRKKNKESISESNKKWRELNKNKRQQYQKEYYQNNKDLYKARGAKYRATLLKQTPDYANISLIEDIYCSCPEGYHIDHIIPLSRGGLHYESNLCYLPARINLSKHNKLIEEFGEEEFNRNVIYWQDHLSCH